MKKINIIKSLTLCAGVALLASCNDLEQSPNNKFTDENFWTPEHADYMVMTAYAQMYNDGYMWDDEKLTDNMWNGYRSEDTHVVRRGLARPTTGRFSWNGIYQGIKSAHTFLAHADQIVGLDDSTKARLVAEARFIRDLFFFRLTNLYGAVPFFMEDPTLEWTQNCTRTSHVEIIETIKVDLEDLINDLPTKSTLPSEENGRITQGAVAMLLARIALMDSDWNGVVTWTERIMNGEYGNYSLYPDYYALFHDEATEYNDEVILDVGYVPSTNRSWGGYKNMHPKAMTAADFVAWCPTESLVESYMTLGGYGIYENGTDWDPEHPYDNRDPRLNATVFFDNSEIDDPWSGEHKVIEISNTESVDRALKVNEQDGLGGTYTGYFSRKYYAPIPENAGFISGLNIIMMRYADVLLMYAEAKNELGQMSADVWNRTIRPIRERAGFTAERALK